MATLNIPSTVEDPNYRYKMPAVRCKVEGSGNGIKTNHMNMRDVAQALKRNPEYVTKYLACELCVHGRYFPDEGKAIFQGAHVVGDLAAKIDSFINSYVLCPGCGLPEIDLFVEGKLVKGKCNACGQSSAVNNVHRVAAFIVKNPPEGSTVGKKPTKEEKRAAKLAKATDKSGEEEGKKKVKKVIKKKVIKKKKKGGDDNSFDLHSMTANTIMLRLRDLYLDESSDPQAFYKEMRTVQLTQDFDNEDRFFLALGAVFGCGVPVADDDNEDAESNFKGEFNRVSVDDFGSQLPYLALLAYDSSKESIAALQKFMYYCATPASYKAHYPLLMKGFYDANIVDDEDIIDYYAKSVDEASDETPYSRARSTLDPLIDWLNQDASDSDGSYDESYDDEDEGTTPVAPKKIGA